MPARPKTACSKLIFFIFYLIAFAAIFLFLARNAFAQVVINEFMPDSSQEWVEFKNASASAEYVKSYWLDDDTNFTEDLGSSKKSLDDLNTSNPSYPYIEIKSFLNNSGDYVVLFDEQGNIIDQYQYTENPGNEISVGRSPDGSGGFFVLSSPTKGSSNSEPRTTPTPTPTSEPEEEDEEEPSSVTPTPTLTPISISTPTPTKKPTPKPTPTQTPIATPSGEILGEEATPTAEAISFKTTQESTPSSFHLQNYLPFVFVGLGTILLGVSGGSILLPNLKKKYNIRRSGKTEEII